MLPHIRGVKAHIQCLVFDGVAVNLKLARRLPRDLAFRYRVLPLARDNGLITVAMANPGDKAARQAVAAALGADLYVVQGDSVTIDRLLTEVWPEGFQCPLRLLVCDQASPIPERVQAYARYLCDTLGGESSWCADVGLDDVVGLADNRHDLVVFGEPDQSLIHRLIAGPADCKAAERIPTSVLIARQPRWPIDKLLVISRGQPADDLAIEWVIRVAKPSQAAVTVLSIIPATPADGHTLFVRYGLANWLSSESYLGRQMHRLALHLPNWDTAGRLRFRQGTPDQQVRSELAEEDYDLVVIAAESADWWSRRLLGELVPSLLRWASQPVLVAR
jgi:nucleotide-binding universal stress UspA family protein